MIYPGSMIANVTYIVVLPWIFDTKEMDTNEFSTHVLSNIIMYIIINGPHVHVTYRVTQWHVFV